MTTAAIIVCLLIIALGAVYFLGRNSIQKDELKQDVVTGEKTNEILQKQRDDRIVGVDDADSLFDTLKKD